MKIDPPFQKIRQAAETTGLSAYFLRGGCKDGSVPCVLSGGVYYVNIPALLRKLGADEEKEVAANGEG
ncbi:hypothetical protein [Evtepia sp.]|uniref:hypothetical protein n=1 Tax=Evtepia sp. TaxID=2773933 RepID=UPI002A824034|nr:hypothetical protein [Evtepia sp.]MDY4431064.1 hypothetical protein [Evtepia sp.]